MHRLAAVGSLALIATIAACSSLGDFADDAVDRPSTPESSGPAEGDLAATDELVDDDQDSDGQDSDDRRSQLMVDLEPVRSIPRADENELVGLDRLGSWLVASGTSADGPARMLIDPRTGRIGPAVLAEGPVRDLAAFDDRAVQLLEGERFASVFDPATLAEIDRLSFEQPLTGICPLGDGFITSTETSTLIVRDVTAAARRRVVVPEVTALTALACDVDHIFAVVGGSAQLVVLTVDDELVEQTISLDGLAPDGGHITAVAFDSAERELYVTGSGWPDIHVLAVS